VAITKTQGATGTGTTIALNSVTAGALLTLQTSYFRNTGTGAAETTPTDTQGTWSALQAPTPAGFSGGGQDVGDSIFFQKNVASGTHTVTPQNNTIRKLSLTEWGSADTTTPNDASNHGETSDTSHTSRTTNATGVLASSDELVLINCGIGATGGAADIGWTDPVSGYTTLQKVVNSASDLACLHAWKTVSSNGSITATFNWTDNSSATSQATIGTFQASPPPVFSRPMFRGH